MSGFIGVNNQFAQKVRQPDAKLQGIITSIYDIDMQLEHSSTSSSVSNSTARI
jgi:hypothetical protein